MKSLNEYLVLELKADTYKSAALKAQKLGDDRAQKFFQAYLDKLKDEFKSSEASDEEKRLNQWYREDKQIFTKLKTIYGDEMSRPFSSSALDPLAKLKLHAGIKIVYQQCFLGTFKDNDGSTVDVRSIPRWIKLSDDKYAFIRNDNKKIIPLSFSAEWDKTGIPDYIYGVYDIDADKLDIKNISRLAEKSFDDLFGDVKDEGMKLINKFLKTINPNHKDI